MQGSCSVSLQNKSKTASTSFFAFQSWNSEVPSPSTPENGESCWIDDPPTSEDESDSDQATSPVRDAFNVIIWDYSSSDDSSDEFCYTPTTPSTISSEATSSHMTYTEMIPSQASSPEIVTSEFTFLPTDYHEETSAIDAWDDELVDTERNLQDAVQDLLPKNAPCNTITGDDNSAAGTSSVNEGRQPLDPKDALLNEDPSQEALEVGRGTRSGRDYHKNYNQSPFTYVNPSGKDVVNAPSGDKDEHAGPKEAFKYDLIEHFKHIPARLHILDLL